MLQLVVALVIIIIQVSNEKRSKINPPVFLSSFNYDNPLENVCKAGKDEIIGFPGWEHKERKILRILYSQTQ